MKIIKTVAFKRAATVPPETLLTGTSRTALASIVSGSRHVRPVYEDSNVSLGGAYLTNRHDLAVVYAGQAASSHGDQEGRGVVLTVRTLYPLFPDEDWVNRAFDELPANDKGNIDHPKYGPFFSELFPGYLGDGHSLSDHYKERYDLLNDRHRVTWQDSLTFAGNVRQAAPLTASQIVRVEYL